MRAELGSKPRTPTPHPRSKARDLEGILRPPGTRTSGEKVFLQLLAVTFGGKLAFGHRRPPGCPATWKCGFLVPSGSARGLPNTGGRAGWAP